KSPAGKKSVNLREVRNIAYMITHPVLILVLIIETKSELGKYIDCLQDRNAIAASASQIEHLAKARLAKKGEEELSHIVAMDLVANLFAFISVERVLASGDCAINDIG